MHVCRIEIFAFLLELRIILCIFFTQKSVQNLIKIFKLGGLYILIHTIRLDAKDETFWGQLCHIQLHSESCLILNYQSFNFQVDSKLRKGEDVKGETGTKTAES